MKPAISRSLAQRAKSLFRNAIRVASHYCLEIMGIGKRAAELAESRAKSALTDDEVVVSFNTDDSASLNKVSEIATLHNSRM